MRLDKKTIKFLKDNNIRYSIKNRTGSYAECPKSYIVIGTKNNRTKNELICTTFHEIAHILNYRNHKFFRYHSGKWLPKSYYRKVALKAERYTDKVAAKLMKKIHPTIKYDYSYTYSENTINAMRNYYGI
jgi:hypothetical protein